MKSLSIIKSTILNFSYTLLLHRPFKSYLKCAQALFNSSLHFHFTRNIWKKLSKQEYGHLNTRQPPQASLPNPIYSAISDVTSHCLLFPSSNSSFLFSDTANHQFLVSDEVNHSSRKNQPLPNKPTLTMNSCPKDAFLKIIHIVL